MAKNYVDSYFFKKYPLYSERLFKFIMNSPEIDKSSKSFEDVRYDVKRRQIDNVVMRILDSPNVILLDGSNQPILNKAFNVVTTKDIKHRGEQNKLKVFINCTGVIVNGKDGKLNVNTDALISHLVSAMNHIIYYNKETKITNNHTLMTEAAEAFASLYKFVIDYIGKVSVDSTAKTRLLYIGCKYFYKSIIGFEDKVASERAKMISKLSDRDINIIDIAFGEDGYDDIKNFVKATALLFKNDKITLDLVTEKWMWTYGPGTLFGLELYPALASMLTDAYVGAYLNGQKTIENVTGTHMVAFTKQLLSIGNSM